MDQSKFDIRPIIGIVAIVLAVFGIGMALEYLFIFAWRK